MVRPDLNAWGYTSAELRRLAVQAQHPRSREGLLALYMIAFQQTNAPPGQPTSDAPKKPF